MLVPTNFWLFCLSVGTGSEVQEMPCQQLNQQLHLFYFHGSITSTCPFEGGRVISELAGLCMTVPEQHLTGSRQMLSFMFARTISNLWLTSWTRILLIFLCAVSEGFSSFPTAKVQSIKPFQSMRKYYTISDLFQYQCVFTVYQISYMQMVCNLSSQIYN